MPARVRPWMPLLSSGLLLVITPGLALAAGTEGFDFGPTWKEILLWGGVGLVGCVAVLFLARFIYGVLLDGHCSVDFAQPLVIAGTVVLWVAIAAAVALFLYGWPQPLTRYAGYGLIGAFVLVLLFGLFGRKR
jgi:hypothetical protein